MECPTCKSQKLPTSFFCSQDCFKQCWKTHKAVHRAEPAASAPASAPAPAATTAGMAELAKSVDPAVLDALLTGARGIRGSETETEAWAASYKFTGPLRPGRVIRPLRSVPRTIARPDYADNGYPVSEMMLRGRSSEIEVHSAADIEAMRKVSKLAREVLDLAAAMVRPGVTGEEIDIAVHNWIIERGAYPSPLNYHGFPKSCCVSVNEVICHGIPDTRPLQDGDIVNLDITLFYNGFHSDLNETFPCGTIDASSKHLLRTAYNALMQGIEMVKPGMLYKDVGTAISKFVEKEKCSVVRTYCGHGISKLFHTSPTIPHYAKNKAVGVMKAGHIFTIEPMINLGDWKDTLWPDEWTADTVRHQ
eukprot:TRINITY_DN8291_c0_g1_i1.p1 TRINITY_DN8291_c0_g1~~TRINITY_DN8291_c0_g1_i1.p1  ORF type:complete len:375 (-),score=70.96 TRINITY_DN8291_c0_g1_i1:136-1221(-)